MKWLLRRLLIVCGVLSVMCAAVVTFGRLDHSPSKLQQYGIALCDGEPCYRGLKLGMEWAQVQDVFPEIGKMESTPRILSAKNDLQEGYITLDESLQFVQAIVIDTRTIEWAMVFNAGEIIAQYSPPCRVYLWYTDTTPGYSGNAVLIYPMMVVFLNITGDLGLWHNFRLQLNSPVETIGIYSSNKSRGCNGKTSDDFGPWRGFTSFVIYRERNLRDSAVQVPTD
jgi:hypothetical protein